jgi:hypothetical protein
MRQSELSSQETYLGRVDVHRFIPRTCTILTITTPHGDYLPILAKRIQDKEGFGPEELSTPPPLDSINPKNWEWIGGKLSDGTTGTGLTKNYREIPVGEMMQEAHREVKEEFPALERRLTFLEPMPISENAIDLILRLNESNTSLRSYPIMAQTWVDELPIIPKTAEHLGGIYLKAFDTKNLALGNYLGVLANQLLQGYLYVHQSEERPDIFEFVLTSKERREIEEALKANSSLPDGYHALRLNESSASVAIQYFYGLYHR